MTRLNRFARRHPVFAYFATVYLVTAAIFLLIVGPRLVAGQGMRAIDALLMFPLMEIGVCAAGTGLTASVGGRVGLRDLARRLGRWRVAGRWYLTLLIPPFAILVVLVSLGALVSPVFAPKVMPLGILFGLFAGLLEEVGWTGYAFPKLRATRDALSASVLLGVLWGCWHLPVVDYLGAASPHGASWLPFFLAFVALVSAMRVLMCWVYANTESVSLAQLIHASSTGFLVVLSPTGVSPAQEALWYAVYAAVLWVCVAVVVAAYGKPLTRGRAVAAPLAG